jgi:hypothetical protein
MPVTRSTVHQCQCEQCQHHPFSEIAKQHRALNRLLAHLDEKSRRRLAGLFALRHMQGGLQAIHQITGLSRMTIRRGRDEIQRIDRSPSIRRPGGGRHLLEKKGPTY